jgi:hypothetical protein
MIETAVTLHNIRATETVDTLVTMRIIRESETPDTVVYVHALGDLETADTVIKEHTTPSDNCVQHPSICKCTQKRTQHSSI